MKNKRGDMTTDPTAREEKKSGKAQAKRSRSSSDLHSKMAAKACHPEMGENGGTRNTEQMHKSQYRHIS